MVLSRVSQAVAVGCALLILATSVVADQVRVPEDFSTLQAAVNAAQPGDVIIVTGGVHPPVVINKALTLVGDWSDRPVIRPASPGEETNPFVQDAAVTLAGPGSGTVTLSMFELAGTADASYFGTAGQALSGGGFSEVRVVHCELVAPSWFQPTGIGLAPHAIALDGDVGWLLVSQSTVIGGEGTYDAAPSGPLTLPSGGDGIRAPSTSVTVVDSFVRGGDGMDVVYNGGIYAPTGCDDVSGGLGGRGVVASALHHAASQLMGGDGAELNVFSPLGGLFYLCTRPSGAAIAGMSDVVDLPGTLFGSGAMVSGSTWTLTWFASSPSVLLVLSPALVPPLDVGSKGLLFMDPNQLFFIALPGAGLMNTSFPVPADMSLLGWPLALQIYDAQVGLTRPVYSSFVPY